MNQLKLVGYVTVVIIKIGRELGRKFAVLRKKRKKPCLVMHSTG